MHYALVQIKKTGKYDKIFGIGCSYGGIQLTNYLGRFHDISLIDGGVGVSFAYSMLVAVKNMSFAMD